MFIQFIFHILNSQNEQAFFTLGKDDKIPLSTPVRKINEVAVIC